MFDRYWDRFSLTGLVLCKKNVLNVNVFLFLDFDSSFLFFIVLTK